MKVCFIGHKYIENEEELAYSLAEHGLLMNMR